MLASFLSCCLLHYHYHLSAANQIPALISIPRHLLQLHHDDGGEQRGVDGGGAQLSPQDGRDPRDAHVGPQCLSPVAPLDTQDGSTEGEDYPEDNHDVQQAQRAGVEGEGLKKPDGECA